MHDLRLGVIGYGLRASLAVTAHRPGRGSRVVAVADPDPAARARAAADLPGADLVADHHRLLERGDVDAVVVLTPDHTHEQVATDTLRAGRAAFVEKPLGISTQECDRILAVAHETGSRLYVGHNMRHMGVVRLMRDIIARGEIGQVQTVWVRHFVGHGGDYYFKDWHAQRRHTTSLLLQKAAHDIDVLHWLAGGYTEVASAFGDLRVYGRVTDRLAPGEAKRDDWFDPARNWPPLAQTGLDAELDVEDVSVVNLRLDNGVLAAYQQCHFTPDYWRNYTVIGDAGRLENFGDQPGAVVKVWNARRSDYRADADAEYPVPVAEGGHGGADSLIMDEFCRFVREGGHTDTSPVAARMSVAAGVAATASLRAGGAPQSVPELAGELAAYFAAGQRR
ncbi:Gfo/Idh/MocA family oxidoreductase [Catellatospora sp. KI3]|uniref:Gfo/Idh/MocA family protein n=1 Tax=Catellatospora sp. KI3 TaxID=3041620 RepID=UPI0024827866|nr:Gfo/Idh/MocA family oxidoreductase [Catellatospora sp. KI3]MDI1461295.1 Gfo/Idh/MocA family oxidoreductase [Catellatospora sp. KI3]